MKQLLLENPRRRQRKHRVRRNRTHRRTTRRSSRRRLRRNYSDYTGSVRTPLSPLYPNAGMSFESIFGRKRKKSRKGKKRSATRKHKRRTYRKRSVRSRSTQRRTKRLHRNRRRYTMKIRKNARRGVAGVRGFVGQFAKRENLSLAGGVLLAPIATGFVRRTITLPTIGTAQVSNAIYGLLIPGLGALLTRRLSPALANGMIIGGIANVVQSFLPATTTAPLTPASRYLGEYLDPRRGMGAYIAPRGAMGSSIPSAFNAWAK